MKYITSELDEVEREEFYRLKKIQEKKKKIREKEELKKKMAGLTSANEEARTIFEEDQDLLFK
jgi:V-type H+-transporting ATPase subunit D